MGWPEGGVWTLTATDTQMTGVWLSNHGNLEHIGNEFLLRPIGEDGAQRNGKQLRVGTCGAGCVGSSPFSVTYWGVGVTCCL